MKNYKHIIVGKRMEKTKDGRTIEIIETTMRDNRPPCKKCNEKERANGSSMCEDCRASYRVMKFEEERLRKKVEGATGNK